MKILRMNTHGACAGNDRNVFLAKIFCNISLL